MIVAAELLTRRRLWKPALPLAATAAPLVYYFVLSRTDASWKLADSANDFPRWPWWVTVLGLAPLAIPALLAYRQRATDFGGWRSASGRWRGSSIFYLPVGTFPFHAMQGLTLPLAVLAVLGLRGLRLATPWLVAGAVALLVDPRHRLPRRQHPRRREQGLPAVLPHAGRARRAASTSTARRNPAACSRRCTAGC